MNKKKEIKTKYKFIFVGDGTVGKTSSLISFSSNKFPEEHVPTIFDSHECDHEYKDVVYKLNLWDTAGQSDFDRVRPLSYPQTDMFFVCCSVVHKHSLLNASSRWFPEIKHYAPGIPIVLVGTKNDLRGNEEYVDQEIVRKDLEKVSNKEGCKFYHECSALTQEGLFELFDKAIDYLVNKKKRKKKEPQKTENDDIKEEEEKEKEKKGKCIIS